MPSFRVTCPSVQTYQTTSHAPFLIFSSFPSCLPPKLSSQRPNTSPSTQKTHTGFPPVFPFLDFFLGRRLWLYQGVFHWLIIKSLSSVVSAVSQEINITVPLSPDVSLFSTLLHNLEDAVQVCRPQSHKSSIRGSDTRNLVLNVDVGSKR